MSPIDNFSLVTGSKLQAYDSRIKIGSMRVQVQTFRGIFRLKRPPLRTLIGCKGNEGSTGKEKWIVTGARIGYDVWGGLEPRAWRAREREPITGVWGLSLIHISEPTRPY